MPLPLSAFQMLCICILTDIAPALLLLLERPEKNLLKREPRSNKDHLIDWKLIFHAYLFIGLMQTFFSHLSFVLYLKWYGRLEINQIFFAFNRWENDSNYSHTQLKEYIYTGQTVTFTSLVIMQIFGHIFCVRTNYKSLFQRPSQWKKKYLNIWLFLTPFVSLTILILIIYLPFVNSLFCTRQIPAEFFFIPLIYCVIIFLLDELRKLFIRRQMFCFPRMAW